MSHYITKQKIIIGHRKYSAVQPPKEDSFLVKVIHGGGGSIKHRYPL